MTMRTFLDRFYDYVKSPEGFNCVEFQYEGIIYQVVAGANICYVDNQGNKHRIDLPDDIEVILDTKIGRKSWISLHRNIKRHREKSISMSLVGIIIILIIRLKY